MSWVVRSFSPANPLDIFSVEEYANEAAAFDDYQDRAESIRRSGGGAEIFNPQGARVAVIMRAVGEEQS